MLKTVLQRRGAATRQDVASDIVSRDVLRIEHYRRNIVQKMPGSRLVRDGILEFDGDAYRLAPPFDTLTESQRLELISACERRIEDHIASYGDQFGGRNDDPVPGSVRYKVLKQSGGRCELCGTSYEEVPLDVDHIIPRNQGGTNDESNLQVLCRTCNAQKGDRDDTDFGEVRDSFDYRQDGCVFCEAEDRIIEENELAFVIEDAYAVTSGHSLVIPRRHIADYFELYKSERNAIDQLLRSRREALLASDDSIEGFNVGANAGTAAGQTVPHAHVHLIPRRKCDVDDPSGGVRGVIPDKQKY